MTASLRPAGLALLLALAACGRGRADTASEVEEFLLADGADPALTAALADPILTDPELDQQAHPHTVRPPEAPVQAQYPAGSAGADGIPATASPAEALCGAEFVRGTEWSRRLPPGWLFPRGRITEAAGNDSGGCRLRFLAFETADDYRQVLSHYRTAATRAGFSAGYHRRGGDHLLGGTNPRTGGAFILVVTPLERGAEAALVVDAAG